MSNMKNHCKAGSCFGCPFYEMCIAWKNFQETLQKSLKTKTNSVYGEIRK